MGKIMVRRPGEAAYEVDEGALAGLAPGSYPAGTMMRVAGEGWRALPASMGGAGPLVPSEGIFLRVDGRDTGPYGLEELGRMLDSGQWPEGGLAHWEGVEEMVDRGAIAEALRERRERERARDEAERARAEREAGEALVPRGDAPGARMGATGWALVVGGLVSVAAGWGLGREMPELAAALVWLGRAAAVVGIFVLGLDALARRVERALGRAVWRLERGRDGG